MADHPARGRGVLIKTSILLSTIVWILLPLCAIIYAISQTLYLILPLYIFSGDAEGYVGIMSYKLKIFGHDIESPALESLSFLAIPVIISIPTTTVLVITGYLRRKQSSGVLIAIGGSGVAVIASGISLGLRSVASLIADHVARNHGHATTAGYIIFQGSVSTPTLALNMPLIAYVFSLALMILLTIYFIIDYLAKRAEHRSVEHDAPGSY
ncbi:hypothetical protein ATG_10350 [Desulfurococcaceae archaeon AG1]|nr:hypothetical protein ATG_10350 [Desulfurococcaceae archaeon AG1]